jgi:hypothetical protein
LSCCASRVRRAAAIKHCAQINHAPQRLSQP